MIGIIDYNAGNVNAFQKILRDNSIKHSIIKSSNQMKECNKYILPGVGHFDHVMEKLKKSELIEPLNEAVIHKKKPILGVCVGMQIMANNSEEGDQEGLGWIPGTVKRFNRIFLEQKPYLPHMGWNTVKLNKEHSLYNGINFDQGFYFVHSFYFDALDTNHVLSTTHYGLPFASSIGNDNIYGTQFHPEKSHNNGEKLIINFCQIKNVKI